MLRVDTFGGFAMRADDARVPEIRGARARALAAYLALHPGRHPRARLAGRFWPDVLDTSARGSLRSALWAVRGALDGVGAGGCLIADRAGAGFDPDALWVDAAEFDRLLREGGREALERAVLLGAEPPLPELADEWVLEAQERHRDRMVDALLELAAIAEREGRPARAVALTREALSHDRLRESSHRDLIRRLAAAGDRAGALAAYRRCRDLLAAEFGAAPAAATRDLAESIRRGAPPAGPAGGARDGPGAPDAAAGAPPAGPPAEPALVGRAPEAAALLDAWRRAASGAGGVAMLTGPAGMGKSRLARDVLARARRDGAACAVGHVTHIAGAPPFGPWSDALAQLVRAGPPPPPQATWPADLARLCPAAEEAWGRPSAPVPPDPATARARLFAAAGEALAACARQGPLVVVLEDLHAADAGTVALVAHVGARLAGLPALLVVTGRPGPALGDLRDALERHEALAAHVALGPMPPGDVARLVDGVAPRLAAAPARRLADGCGGSPLLAVRAARAAATGVDVDAALRDAMRAPLAGLPEPARTLVAVAAVAGRALAAREAAAALGAADLDAALADAAAAGLLEADRGAVRFVHDLVRSACHAALPDGRRREAHAALAGALSRGAARRPAEVASHLRAAGDDDRARAHLLAAAAAARALGALDAAAGFLRDAAHASDAAGDSAGSGEAWIALAEVEAWRGDRAAVDAAFARGRRALEDAGDVAALAAALAERARWFRTIVCYPQEVHRSSAEALELVERARLEAPETRLLATAGMAWGEAVAGDPRRAAALGRRLDALLAASDDQALHCEARLTRASLLMREARSAAARAEAREAADIADRLGWAPAAIDARLIEATCAAFAGDLGDVLAILPAAPDPVRVGSSLACQARAARAHALSRLGRHDEAVAAAREQVTVAAAVAAPDLAATADADLGAVLLAAGRPGEALAALEAALDRGAPRTPRAACRLAAAEAACAAGDARRAAGHLERLPFEPVRIGDEPGTLPARLDRVTGLLLAVRGDAAGAERHLRAALRAWGGLPATGDGGPGAVGAMVDLGRPPVAGLVEPAREIARLEREIAGLRARAPAAGAAR